jgi:hypothetical protein
MDYRPVEILISPVNFIEDDYEISLYYLELYNICNHHSCYCLCNKQNKRFKNYKSYKYIKRSKI